LFNPPPRDPAVYASSAVAIIRNVVMGVVSGSCRIMSASGAMRPARCVSSKNALQALQAAEAPFRH